MSAKTEFTPKQGDMINVRQLATSSWTSREFVVSADGYCYCKARDHADGDAIFPWAHAELIPSVPKPIPFTPETWPRQVVWVQDKNRPRLGPGMVVGLDATGVDVRGSAYSYGCLAADFKMSLDHCETWGPCHHIPEEQ